MSKKKSSSGKWPWRYPPTAAGIQVNHCKNPRCANFGVPPKDASAKPRGGARIKGVKIKGAPAPGDYTVVATGRKEPALRCELCNEIVPMQSNLAIAEELLRISAYLEPPSGPACTNDECEFYDVPITKAPKNYVRFGTSTHGTPRYRCKACKSVFAHGGKATHRQRETHRNRDIFEHLVNSVPLRRTIKLLGITPGTLYRRIDFIWRQCRQFAGERERVLAFADNLGKRYITVDRQALMVNWTTRKDRRNTLLLSCGSADLETGYVYGVHLNYDPDITTDEVLADIPRYGDDKLAQPFRRYARVWLPQDFEDAARRADGRKRAEAATAEGLEKAIEATYADAVGRDNVEAGDGPQPSTRVPVRGMQIHEQVSMNAHIQFVTRLLRGAEKLRFFVDQESGLRAAIMAAVPKRVLDRTADAYYVRVLKEATVDTKRNLVRQAQQRLKKLQADEGLSAREAEIRMIRAEMERVRAIGKWQDRWLWHPLPDMREPEKQVCWLTDVEESAEDPEARESQLNHAARLYRKASLRSIDRFFMQVRRGVTLAERGIVSASSGERRWFGKNAYDPAILAKMLEIFRVYFNYCEVGEDGMTPAMRMGLARGPVASEDILYFVRRPEEPIGASGAGEEAPEPAAAAA